MTKNDYTLFSQFIQQNISNAFANVDRQSQIVLDLEKMTENNDQFFLVGDVLKSKILFSSKRSMDMIGVKPEDVDPSMIFIRSHPENQKRHNLARTKLFNIGQSLFIEKKGTSVISTTVRIKYRDGRYYNTLVQCMVFYSTVPYETTFVIQVISNISWADKFLNGYHFYNGNDYEYFRIPDERLLRTGCPLSEREFEILELISQGMSSEEIAKKIFLSVHTVNTHRRNIIVKTRCISTHNLIIDYKNRGLL